MSAYLQRLLARAAPGAELGIASVSIPAAPLASPLALHDQRLGLPEFDAPVPSEVIDDPAADPVESAISIDAPRNDPVPGPKLRSPEPKQRPELRIVNDVQLPATKEPSTMKAREAAPKLEPEAERLLRPGPLDISADELKPATAPLHNDAPVVESEAAEPPPQRPQVQNPNKPEPGTERAERRIPELHSDATAERPDVTQHEQAQAEAIRRPTKTLPVPAQPQSHRELTPSPLDLEPVEQRLPTVPHAPEPPAPCADEPVREGSITIGEIVIDVHEPQRAQVSEAGAVNQTPATAAAASVIGPLPVRHSAVSLFGMRRR